MTEQIGTIVVPPTTLTAGSKQLSTSAVQLSSTNIPCHKVYIQNPVGSVATAIVGDSSNQVWQIVAGDSFTLEIDNVNKVYAKSASLTPTINWLVVS